jgi:hypothetical protein
VRINAPFSHSRPLRQRLSLFLGVSGLWLMPFSTSPEQGGVIAFGLPLIAIALLLVPEKVLGVLLRETGTLGALIVVAGFLALIPLPLSIISPDPAASSARAFVFLFGYVFSLWMIAYSSDPSHYVWIKRGYFGFGLILSTYYIANFAIRTAELGLATVALERYVGGGASLPWGASNVVAGVILLTLLAYLALNTKELGGWAKFLPAASIAAITLTFSRTVLFYTVISLFVLSRRSGSRQILNSFLFIALVAGAVGWWLTSTDGNAIEQLLENRIDAGEVSGAGGRTDIWLDRIPRIPEGLVFPFGYYSSIYILGDSPHNYFITVALEQGMLGAVISVAFFSLLFYYLRPEKKSSHKGTGSAKTPMLRFIWIVVLGHLMVEDLNFIQPYMIAFWGLFALSVFERKKARESKGLGIS